MPVVWYFMFGAPGESRDTVQETLDFIDNYIPQYHLVLLVSGIRIFKGTPLEATARIEGQILTDDNLLMPVWYQPQISREELFRLINNAVLRHPNYIALQDIRIPHSILQVASSLHRFFRSSRPLWQYLRHLRRLMNTVGMLPHSSNIL